MVKFYNPELEYVLPLVCFSLQTTFQSGRRMGSYKKVKVNM